ncbi:chromosome segregation protein SMC [Clostridium sp. E02]|uniref:chromosome segregation protein SMC n=1 Tax=Clostridium sp. E02 TaxID=2487134 RepID=UPI000F527708|nr:chromosome segregation protein SMC [Clostridium sp. E02]
MYLKSIEIQGFKSFANKILFDFHNGITGIVGPNGSGKSNVADAVRWVLGEQKVKQLRSSSMQDVIFSGTELRKPQGFAYVAITLDNSDHHLAIEYDQVTVSRRVYRSGESEYRINGSACRLKDIHELFYDTGIGKEGYSIIGQGQIDKILSGKPEERRELFDEAAGIVKFKRRKAIALKKLEGEKQNLVRVNDILTELEKQVEPLARQSESAREYLRLKEELKQYDVNQFLMESENLRIQMKELKEKETIVEKDLEDAKKSSETIRAQYETLDTYLTQLDEAINEERNEKNRYDMESGNLEGRINVLNEQIRAEQMNAEHISGRVQTIHSEIDRKKEQAKDYEKERSAIADSVAAAMARRKKAEEVLSAEDEKIHLLEQQIEEGKGTIIDFLNEKASLKAKQQRYETMLEQVAVRRSEVCQKLLKFKSDESEQEEQITVLRRESDEIERDLAKRDESQATSESRTEELEKGVKQLNITLNDKHQEYHTSSTKLESLHNIVERYEGYGGSIRRVMEAKGRIRGIHGVVADLITVPKKYEIAIETALGGSIQNIVTDSEETAKGLIDYLKKNRYGRATFLPLTSIGSKNQFHQDKALDEPGVLGLANTLVETDGKYEGLINYLLGRVVVVDTIDHAIFLAKKYKYSLRIVTLEGELLSAGGSMTGGAFKNTSNLLGRKREIEELEDICTRVRKEMEQIRTELVLNEGLLVESKEELERNRKEKQQLYLRQNTVNLNLHRIEDKKAEIIESYEDLERENTQLELQIKEIDVSRRELIVSTEELEKRSLATNGDLDEWDQILLQARSEREKSLNDYSEIQLATSTLKQKDDFELENIKRVNDDIKKLEDELSGLSNGTESSEQVIEGKQNEIQEVKKRMEELKEKVLTLEQSFQEKIFKKEEKTKQQKDLLQKREERTGRIGLLDKELFRLQSQNEKLDERMESHVNYMWNEYELTFSTAETLRKKEWTSLSDIKRMIASLKEDIHKLGNVNVNAIEDYKEVAQRYEFMKSQHDDLVIAEGTLLKIIEELDTGMRRQFDEKFREIKAEFDQVFKELFGGGRGTLELVEDEDILEAGIQIISQPPGKKLQNMMQLSGGEKALTAIALLFAIQNLKPSPFCLLDEIEAALDDSNVDRFANYLHKLTKYTQFIVITHRRGTMITADRLYGITMQEKGVSTLVSVNLIEEDLESKGG